MACREDVADFLKEFGFISEGLRADDRFFLSLFTDNAEDGIKEFVSRFDMIYVFSSEENCQLASGIRSLFAGTQVIRTLPPQGVSMHVADYRSEQVGLFGGACSYPLLAVSRNRREMAGLILRESGYDHKRPLVAVHPGSGGLKKRWPMERFEEVMKRLRTGIDCNFVIFSGPAEGREMRKEIESCAEGMRDCCIHIANAGLGAVASLLSLCDLYVGNDSGITHLASCSVGGKIIAVFGPTDPLLWAPKSDRCAVVASDRGCSPCIGMGTNKGSIEIPVKCGIECVADITVERVLDEMIKAL